MIRFGSTALHAALRKMKPGEKIVVSASNGDQPVALVKEER